MPGWACSIRQPTMESGMERADSSPRSTERRAPRRGRLPRRVVWLALLAALVVAALGAAVTQPVFRRETTHSAPAARLPGEPDYSAPTGSRIAGNWKRTTR
jgi:hypothetical protein